MEDIELDADGSSLMGNTLQTVRKSIPLNLKKGKPKMKPSKSNKSKKERKDYRGDDDKTTRRTKSQSSSSDKKMEYTDEDEREDEELDWSHQIKFLGEKVQDPMIHICEKCLLPILIYGRLSPCKHVFCLSCAEKSNGNCPRCEDRIDRIEPAGIGQIFVCSFGGSRNGVSGCRRSYLSKRDLVAHIKHRHEKEASNMPDSEVSLQQPNIRMPFFQAQLPHPVGMNLQNPNQVPGGNTVVLAGIQSGGQQQIFVDANRMPLIQTLPPNIGLTQTQFQGSTYLPSSRNQFQNLQNQLVTPSPNNLQTSSSSRNEPSGNRQVPAGNRQVPAVNPNLARVPNSAPSQSDWNSSSSLQSSGQEWNQSSSSYQQQYYK